MAYLLDTGILLRIADTYDAQHPLVRVAVGKLGNQRETLIISTQNVAEFCNVATRPKRNNGLGLAPRVALDLFEREVESICTVVPEPDATHDQLKRLIAKYGVVGKQVHDTRLVAMMLSWQIENILTLNDRDFRRYEPEGIRIVAPDALINPNP
jgi:predicted nucleic acid-binding protein